MGNHMYTKITTDIKITKHGDKGFKADPVGQPGIPIVGSGDTPYDALIDLLKNNQTFNISVIEEAEDEITDEEEMVEEELTETQLVESGDYDDLLEFLELCNISPEYIVCNKVWRFKENRIIRYLVDYHREETEKTHDNNRGLNLIYTEAAKEGYTLRDFVQLYIYMGYSLCGFGEVFGEPMNKVLRIRYDSTTGEFIDQLGATEKTIRLIDESIWNSK